VDLNVQTKILRKARTPEEYTVYLAALEWDLIDPIVIENREDVKSEATWLGRLTPYNHQVANLITYCRRLPVSLLADDVGLGKTISAGLIMAELAARGRLQKTLIVCPKLLGPQWQEELDAKFGIESQIAIGKDLKKADPNEIGAVITTYQSARLYLDEIPTDRFQMLILDEAHKLILRNLYGVEKPPQVATKFRGALEDRRFRFVLMLTATPIHNRLWDIYSLVDLLTVARGHKNPFGTEGMFARRFIADDRESARRLKPEAREEFRSIVYGYMSRVRRADAKLSFPDRVVLMHKADPTPAEQALVQIVAKYIAKLNRLAQISILQALASSPDALRAQLDNMARNGTVPAVFASDVSIVVRTMPISAKLASLGALANELAARDTEKWRMVIFTGRRETQTTIQAFLEQRGWAVGIINGSTTATNKNTLARFRQNPPAFHVIVSTEAGSEGINLQVANVLVNYDLPWNPMIVEQRIGRVQRLASEHAKVSIYNVMLRGTFEEYIVGRLMEKLQMAAHAIGDIESLLEATGLDDDEENGEKGFEEKIRELVVAALLGKDIEAAARQAEESIQAAKTTLEREKDAIDTMLGGMEGAGYVGPRPPHLDRSEPRLDAKQFVLRAFPILGATVRQEAPDLYMTLGEEGRELFRFSDAQTDVRASIRYSPGSPAFQRLVDRIAATGIHALEDADLNSSAEAARIIRHWAASFGGTVDAMKLAGVERCMQGDATLRVRATVAHDSYERVLRVICDPSEHKTVSNKDGLGPIAPIIEDPHAVGVRPELLGAAAEQDPSISEFVRFYKERRDQELAGARDDERKRKRLEEDFTPQLEVTLVGLQGRMHRKLRVKVEYHLDDPAFTYSNIVSVVPHAGELSGAPALETCTKTGRRVPQTCLQACEISYAKAISYVLVRSQLTGRAALPEHTVKCSLSGKTLLSDEVEKSAASGQLIDKSLLITSLVSGKRGEAQYFGRCEITNVDALQSELSVSQVSGRRYRTDEQARSAVSGKTGHRQEFVQCSETTQWLLPTEGEQCAVTGARVMPGILEICEVTRKRVLPSQLEGSFVSGKRALHRLFSASSVSGKRLLASEAISSVTGTFCAPSEAVICAWSGNACHPDDIRECNLTCLAIHVSFATVGPSPRLRPLADLLDGSKQIADRTDLWELIASRLNAAVKGKIHAISATTSPSGTRLAVVAYAKVLFGIRVTAIGFIYDIDQTSVVGAIAKGRRTAKGWERRPDSTLRIAS
jgi:superfamily II DNA or RNA helicase